MRITAAEARNLAKGKSITEKLDEYLDEIYCVIEKSACVGKGDTSVCLPSFAASHKQYISESLSGNGYKVKFKTYDNFRGDYHEYFIISWKE